MTIIRSGCRRSGTTEAGASGSIFKQRRHMRPRSRGALRPSLASLCRPPKQEGAGKTGCALHPRSRVHCYWQRRTRADRFSGGNPAFPAQWFTAYSALSLVTGLSCHHRRRDAKHPMQSIIADLTPASGRQDHTASPSATTALVIRRHRVHRIPPRVRDDREPPLSSGETFRIYADLQFLKIRIFSRGGIDEVLGELTVGLICRGPRPRDFACCRTKRFAGRVEGVRDIRTQAPLVVIFHRSLPGARSPDRRSTPAVSPRNTCQPNRIMPASSASDASDDTSWPILGRLKRPGAFPGRTRRRGHAGANPKGKRRLSGRRAESPDRTGRRFVPRS
jgi:hypothetical protein